MCGSESVLRQNLINCKQSFQLCNKGLKRRSFATKMWHCFPLNNEVVTAAVILCQIIGSKENSSIIMLLRFAEVLETLENNVLKSQLLECYKAFSFAMRKWFAQFAYLLVTKVSVIYCSKFCSENLSRNYKLYVLLCTLGNMKELKEKKKKSKKDCFFCAKLYSQHMSCGFFHIWPEWFYPYQNPYGFTSPQQQCKWKLYFLAWKSTIKTKDFCSSCSLSE